MLKLYVACMGWQGSAVAIAHSKEEAIRMIVANHGRFSPEDGDDKFLQEYPLQEGYVAGDSGDA